MWIVRSLVIIMNLGSSKGALLVIYYRYEVPYSIEFIILFFKYGSNPVDVCCDQQDC